MSLIRRHMPRRSFVPLLPLLCSLPMAAAAQEQRSLPADLATARPLLLAERGVMDSTLATLRTTTMEPRKVWLAVVLSAAVPGAGQLYADAPLWRTILYGGIEATAWTLYFVYDAKGDKGLNDFQNYADTHWDVTRYVSWIADNYQRWSDEEVDKGTAADALSMIYKSKDPTLPPWERIDFGQLNRLERAVRLSFSHTLPVHGDGQYYEEIGKYTQYRAGWDDHSAIDTLVYDNSKVTQHNRDYTLARERTNAYYDYATTAMAVILLNHVASMLDALFQARSYNASIRANIHGSLTPNDSPYPELTLRVNF